MTGMLVTGGRTSRRLEVVILSFNEEDNLPGCLASVEGLGKLYVVEYCRQTETVGPGSAGYGRGGRVLEVTTDP